MFVAMAVENDAWLALLGSFENERGIEQIGRWLDGLLVGGQFRQDVETKIVVERSKRRFFRLSLLIHRMGRYVR